MYKRQGYNPVNQLVGYILSEDPTYITTYKGARSLIRKVDRDDQMCIRDRGTDVHIDGSFEAAIHEGVRRGYTDGYLRKSIVTDPVSYTHLLHPRCR